MPPPPPHSFQVVVVVVVVVIIIIIIIIIIIQYKFICKVVPVHAMKATSSRGIPPLIPQPSLYMAVSDPLYTRYEYTQVETNILSLRQF